MDLNGWVKWSNWTEHGCVQFGLIRLKNVNKNIRKFAKEAAKLMEDTGADHVLYAIKTYDKDGKLYEVKFYQKPMTDEEYEAKVAILKDVLVYAQHAKR